MYDQADGLRRMFSIEPPRVIEIVAGRAGVGRTTVAVNLGVALARAGRHVLLVDCADRHGESRALRYLGLGSPAASAASGHSIAVPGAAGLCVLPLSRNAVGLSPSTAQICTARLLAQASFDCVLVSGALIEPVLPPEEHHRRDVLVVLSRAASSITDAYALIKRMHAHGAPCRFHVVVNRAGSDAEAQLIYRNMAQAARGYLDVTVEMLGFVPADAALERAAAEGRSVLDVSPRAPAASAFRRLADAIGGPSMPRPARAALAALQSSAPCAPA